MIPGEARVQLRGDVLQGHPVPEHRIDTHAPSIVTSVAEPMRDLDVVRGEMRGIGEKAKKDEDERAAYQADLVSAARTLQGNGSVPPAAGSGA
jgi:hypothetical protein